MIPAQFHVDILTELGQIIPNYKYSVPSFVIDELEKIKKRSKGKDKIAASVALKISESPEINVISVDLKRKERVDDALLRISKVLCTNDIGLKRRARNKGITVIYLRQKKYLDVDGYLGL
ncbi:MAG: twitching motility protein PilT [Methanobacterium sp.]|uniref:type II toxin-antitoxin system VapC family toxin n=1 Tax=Methanobacterium sp. TaxID=2164 RepID=UPI003D650111|nr:twitching motility protein PilT [Methanobacterium sp.]